MHWANKYSDEELIESWEWLRDRYGRGFWTMPRAQIVQAQRLRLEQPEGWENRIAELVRDHGDWVPYHA